MVNVHTCTCTVNLSYRSPEMKQQDQMYFSDAQRCSLMSPKPSQVCNKIQMSSN